jgi:hypothetical protein
MTAPPVLTAERIDAMLSVMAEVCLESVVEAGQRQKAAEDFEAFERAGRTLQRACRNLRQTIAMKQRFDREEARKADDARKRAEGVRAETERTRRDAVARQHTRVRRHFERILWDEYDDDDAQELFEDVDRRLTELADEPDFLETPTETLILRLAEEIGLGEEPEADADDPPPPPPVDPPAPVAVSAGPPDLPPDPEPPPEVLAEAPPDPPPSPEPPPEPYIPPWERLAPGQRMPGGSGW